MRNIHLSTREVYHIYNRGVDKRKTYLNKYDYQRFVDGLRVFNSVEQLDGRRFSVLAKCEIVDPIVNILAYCIMPNHFHLLLEQRSDDGITKFIQKMTTSYTMYFNKRNQRSGALFQGVFKRSHIKNDFKLIEMTKYIHSNPAKLFGNASKENLINYPWSSFSHYAGIIAQNKILSNTSIVLDQFGSPEKYVEYVMGET